MLITGHRKEKAANGSWEMTFVGTCETDSGTIQNYMGLERARAPQILQMGLISRGNCYYVILYICSCSHEHNPVSCTPKASTQEPVC